MPVPESIILTKRKAKVTRAASPSPSNLKLLQRKRKAIRSAWPSQQRAGLLKSQRKGGYSKLDCYNPDDRISQLQEEILLLILSFLTIQEAAVTSLLSTRWRYLWASVPRLDFNASFFPIELEYLLPVHLTHKYVRRVGKVVRLYKGNSLEELRLQFGLTMKHKRFIDWCVKFALSKQVKKLELNFNLPFERSNNSNKKKLYTFGVRAVDQATPHGSPTRVCRWSSCYFKSLTSLCLRSVSLSGDVLDGLLLNCPVLEMLTLQHVDDLEYVKVVGPSLRLKHLDIEKCFGLKKIELYDASIVSFKRLQCEGHLFMRNLPCLIDLSLTTWSKLTNELHAFSSYLGQLQRLRILVYHILMSDEEIQPIYKLSNLRELEIAHSVELDGDLLRLLPLIDSSPYLEKIVIRILNRSTLEERTSRKFRKVETCVGLEHLKVVSDCSVSVLIDEMLMLPEGSGVGSSTPFSATLCSPNSQSTEGPNFIAYSFGMRSSIILSKRKRKVPGSASTSTHSVKFAKRNRNVIGSDSSSQQSVDLLKIQRKVVRLYKGNSLEEFRLQLGLSKKHKRFVDWCVKFALSKQVKKLELNFNGPHEVCNSNAYHKQLYTFGVRALNQSTPHGSSTPVYRWSLRQFKSLTSLCLRSVSMCGDVLDGILVNCPVLEILTLQHVDDLEYVRVVGPSLRLKHLAIEHCEELTKIELYDASIVSFKRFSFAGDLFMRNLPHLVELSLSTFLKLANEFHAFSSYLGQLECLSIIAYRIRLNDEEIQPIYKLSNLLELEIAHTVGLNDDLLMLLPIIEGSPYLRKIAIRVLKGTSLEERTVEDRKSRKFVKVKSCLDLAHLNVLKLAGYRGRATEDEFISCIIENAAALHTIIIDLNYQSSVDAFFGRREEIHEVEDYVRRHAKEWLEGIIPAHIQLIIV
ncbi:unnamed protein product [Linum trigynum]|uniref:FBD domain-containing protein n=1 Tax=Linum trigynum TaxID=586398 RepID=A0AAV2EJB3_9ROSI